MRHVKMLSLTAVAAVAAMAFIGAGSAMATGNSQLCTTNTEPCTSGAGAVHFTSVGEPLLSTTGPVQHILCLSGLASGTAEALGNPTGVTVTSLTWTGCYTLGSGIHNCEVNTVTNGLIDVLRTAVNLGTATALNTEVLVKCGAFMKCILGGASTTGLTVEGALHNGGTGHGNLKASGIALGKVASPAHALCPSTVTWTATYESLTHLWLST